MRSGRTFLDRVRDCKNCSQFPIDAREYCCGPIFAEFVCLGRQGTHIDIFAAEESRASKHNTLAFHRAKHALFNWGVEVRDVRNLEPGLVGCLDDGQR